MELRPYQQAALSAIIEAMRTERFLLVQAATGAGKTILFSALIKYCMEQYHMRIGILAHREILVRQAYEKLLKVWPEGKDRTGLACSSVSHDIDLFRPVVIGSPQTLAGRLNLMPPLDLIIIDECHRVPPANEKSQYKTFLDTMEQYYPQVRVMGVTATPFRLGHGYIYGDHCRPGKKNWWPKLHASIGISTLQEQGFLVPLRTRQSDDITTELGRVGTSKGEFNTSELSDVMEKELHIRSAVHAWQNYGEGRSHVVAFCVTIRHAEKLKDAFLNAGVSATVVHSQMGKEERAAAMRDFEEGRCRVVCNVGVLTEGWDCTAVDCILMCRPTLSPALYVQMVGRGLRIHPGKTDCLLLDLSGNCLRHGAVDDPFVDVPSGGKKKEEKKQERMKVCPHCESLIPLPSRECPECGYLWPETVIVEKDDVRMSDVSWGAQAARVTSWKAADYISKKGNHLFRLSLLCAIPSSNIPVLVNHFFDFEAQSGVWMQGRARTDWRTLTGAEPPITVEEALSRQNELHIPEQVQVKRRDRFYNVTSWRA